MYLFGGIREANLTPSAAGIVGSISCRSDTTHCINPYFSLLQKPVAFVNVDTTGKEGLQYRLNGTELQSNVFFIRRSALLILIFKNRWEGEGGEFAFCCLSVV